MGEAYAGVQTQHKGSGTRDTARNKNVEQIVSNAPPAEDRCDGINERIRQEVSSVCHARGISYVDLARMAGLSIAVVGRILAKSRVSATNSPKFAHVILIYQALGLTLPFGEGTAPLKKYSQDELTELLARVISSPSFIPSNTDRHIAERQAVTLIATGGVQPR